MSDADDDVPAANNTVPKQLAPYAFKPGASANPAGRPKGSRNKLGEAFIADLYADWTEHGVSVIQRVREEKPDQYLKVIAGILPREINVETSSDLSDDDLMARIRQLSFALGFSLLESNDDEEEVEHAAYKN